MDGEYRCRIEKSGRTRWFTLRFIKEDGLELPSRITCSSVCPKADKMELVIRRRWAGAFAVVPVAAGAVW